MEQRGAERERERACAAVGATDVSLAAKQNVKNSKRQSLLTLAARTGDSTKRVDRANDDQATRRERREKERRVSITKTKRFDSQPTRRWGGQTWQSKV